MSNTKEIFVTKAELLAKLAALKQINDKESLHIEADQLLLDFIADADIEMAFLALDRWYA